MATSDAVAGLAVTDYSAEEYRQKLDNLLISSCEYLRQEFVARWKLVTKTDWRNGDLEQQKEFLASTRGQRLLKTLPVYQITIFANWCIEEWDITLHNTVLQNFGPVEMFKAKNEAVRKLKNLRNEMAHSSVTGMSKKDYNSKLATYRNSCMSLGVSSAALERDIQRASITSAFKAWETVKEKLKEALLLAENNNKESAVSLCSEAMETPSLTKENLGSIYETRAEIYLNADNTLNSDILEQVRIDLDKATELNNSSWKAYFLRGKWHKYQRKLDEAIINFSKALEISPAQTSVRSMMESCEGLLKKQENEEYIQSKVNTTHVMTQLDFRDLSSDRKYSLQEVLDDVHGHIQLSPLQSKVIRGYKILCGSSSKQDYKKAFKYFQQAEKFGSAEGTYFLGHLYERGLGIKQNFETALTLFHKAIQCSLDITATTPYFNKNFALASAQTAIGNFYREGLAVKKDFSEAANWYKKAMMNGMASGANNLAMLYHVGYHGIPQDQVLFGLCLKFAIQLNDPNGAWNLVMYYLQELEPEWSLAMLQIGRDLGHAGLINWPDEKFKKRLEKTQRARNATEKDVVAFEKDMQLSVKGWTFLRRQERMETVLRMQLQEIASRFNLLNKNSAQCLYPDHGGSINMKFICALAYQTTNNNLLLSSSDTAKFVASTIVCAMELRKMLENLKPASDSAVISIVQRTYAICSYGFEGLEILTMLLSPSEVDKLHLLLDRLQGYLSRDRKDEHDMKVRVCLAQLKMCLDDSKESCRDDTFAMLKDGLSRYPDKVHFYYLLMFAYSSAKNWSVALNYIKEGLKQFPSHNGLLFAKAGTLRMDLHARKPQTKDDYQNALEAYQAFLANVAEDHNKRPEAFYQMAEVCVQLFWMTSNKNGRCCKNTAVKVREFYDLGIAAEKLQLECYLPYGISPMRRNVEYFLEAAKFLDGIPSVILNSYSDSVLSAKPYLKNPAREMLLKTHRVYLGRQQNRDNDFPSCSYKTPDVRSTFSEDMAVGKAMSLLEMNPIQSKVYENRVIELLIIDEAVKRLPILILIGEDNNGDVILVNIFNTQVAMANFEPGCRVAILNPHMDVTEEMVGIRVHDSKCLIFRGQVKSMCRFCGGKKALHKCSKCLRPYCSRECQKLDWRMFGHKLICQTAKT